MGKTSIARALAGRLGATYLRIDTIEQALRSCDATAAAVSGSFMTSALPAIGPEGYVVAYRVAAENLALGRIVVADSVNPIEVTRRAWREVAEATNARLLEVEVICSDPTEHRRRVEERVTDVGGLRLPRWEEVERREYEPWSRSHLTLDTNARPPETCVEAIAEALAAL